MMRFPLLAAFVFLAALVAAEPPAKPAKPNFVIMIADDMTYRDLGCYGGQGITPNVDQLAREGVRFGRCFQSAPMCSPTRHSLYTGMYPVRTGAYPNHTFVSRPDTVSVAQRLQAEGYLVGLAGKRHIKPESVFPFVYLADPIDFDQVSDFIGQAQAAEKPFCLIVASHNPHNPWKGGDRSRYDPATLKLPPYWADTAATRDDYRNYLAEVTVFDDEVGQLRVTLAAHQCTDETALILLSEQGTSQARAKWNLYDAGVRSGCVIRWPGVTKPGRVTEGMIEYVDVLPTMLDAIGAPITADLEGRSFMPLLRGETETHKAYAYSIQTMRGVLHGSEQYGIRSVRSTRYRYILNLTPDEPYSNGSLFNQTFLSWREAAAAGDASAQAAIDRLLYRPAVELYDEETDPFELTNLAGDPELAAVEADLRSRLDVWMIAQGDQGRATELDADAHLNRNRDVDDQDPAEPKALRRANRQATREAAQPETAPAHSPQD